MNDIIYFELDNWFAGANYPNAEPFLSWMSNDFHLYFADDEWCKENGLCVEAGPIDQSICFCIAAKREWVEKNCPLLLTNEDCGSYSLVTSYNQKTQQMETKKHCLNSKYSKFICEPESNGEVYGHISGWAFPKYCKENFGVHWNDYYYSGDEN